MNKRTKQTIQKLSKLIEEFGFDVGMHNACYVDAIQKRIQKYGDDTEEFYESLLSLIINRLKYLKNRSITWHIENPSHQNNAKHLIEKIISNSNNVGTIIAIKNDKTVDNSYSYFLKTINGWISIYNLKTINGVITAELTNELINVSNLINKEDSIFLVHRGIDNNKLIHLTDLEALPIGSTITTPNNTYTKNNSNTWKSNNGNDVNIFYFIDYLETNSVILE